MFQFYSSEPLQPWSSSPSTHVTGGLGITAHLPGLTTENTQTLTSPTNGDLPGSAPCHQPGPGGGHQPALPAHMYSYFPANNTKYLTQTASLSSEAVPTNICFLSLP